LKLLALPSALAAVEGIASDQPELENGGLCFHRNGTLAMVTGPGPNAVRTPSSFRHDPDFNREMISTMAISGLQLAGEWHSHPRGTETLGDDDVKAHAGRRCEAGLPGYLALLAVRQGESFSLKAFLLSDANGDQPEKVTLRA
jgi:hypothetical protein